VSLEGLATDTLNLPNVKTLRHVVSVGQHTYESASINPTGQCCMFARPNGTKRQVFADTPREGMPAVIHHKRRRWSCAVCGGSPYEDLPWAAEGRKMTERLGGWILDQATQRPFVAVANDCGLDPGTVTNVFEERAKPAVLPSLDWYWWRRRLGRCLRRIEKVPQPIPERHYWMMPASTQASRSYTLYVWYRSASFACSRAAVTTPI
jgi:transposase